jgi:hypothetical protein
VRWRRWCRQACLESKVESGVKWNLQSQVGKQKQNKKNN